ncbi:MAG: ABC transporter permease [Saprospiraceae bacterium]|nr:ABC transporter permease [Saprospiraceae bacterium]
MKSLITYMQKLGLTKGQIWGLGIFLFFVVFGKIIAFDGYLVAFSDNGISVMSAIEEPNFGIRAPIPYSANSIDKNNRKTGPWDKQDVSNLYYRHWLGTDSIGRDILAGIIHGSYLAFLIGFVASLLALMIGSLMAYLSGYFGNTGIRIPIRFLWIGVLLILVNTYFLFYGNVRQIVIIISITVMTAYFLHKRKLKLKVSTPTWGFPLDIIVLRLIEVFKSIPALFLILVLLPILGKPSYWNVIWIIALTRWPTITRHLRAEILNVRKENFITAAQSSGLSDSRIFVKYILPLSISPLIIVTAFGISSAVLLESTLSFLGIGVPVDVVTWGGILKEARLHLNAWWLALFPGLCIYGLIYLFNSIGDRINDYVLKSNRQYEGPV